MKEFIIYIFKSGICISIFLLIYQLFLRRSTFFRFNRFYLLSALWLSFILPLFKVSYIVSIEKLNLPVHIATAQENIGQSPHNTSFPSYWLIIFTVYITGCIFQILRGIKSYYRLYNYFRNGSRYKENNISIIQNEKIPSPFSFFNTVFWNKHAFSETEKDIILKHEITHIRQKHWIDLCCSECALILQWFNPCMWIYVCFQKENHEFLADKQVLTSGISTAVYKATLINQQLGRPIFSFTNSFNYSNNLNRLKMMGKVKSNPFRRMGVLVLLPIFGVFFKMFAEPVYIYPDNGESIIVEVLKGDSITLEAEEIYVVIDGVSKSIKELQSLKPELIEEITVLKDEAALKLYGDKGKNGVIIVVTKMFLENQNTTGTISNGITVTGYNSQEKAIVTTDTIKITSKVEVDESSGVVVKTSEEKIIASEEFHDVLLIIDGKEVTPQILNELSADNIESISVYKDEDSIKKYGEKGKNGVVEITTKAKVE